MKVTKLRRRFGGLWSLNENGDTIVEVLITITIISMVLGGAYITSRAGLAGIRQSQERSEALKVAESQVEVLRATSSLPTAVTSASPTAFCFAHDGTIATFNGALPSPASTDPFNSPNPYPANCIVNSAGAATTLGVPYHIGILYDNASKIFTTHVRWNHVTGGGNDEVIFKYRLTQ